jgi:hypothetical protein
MAIDDPTEKIDPTFSINVGRRRFIEVSVGAVAGVSLNSLMSGCGGTQGQEGYLISSEVYTTRVRAIVPDNSGTKTILPWEPSTFKENNYGLWHYVPGFDHGKDSGIMPASYNVSSATNNNQVTAFNSLDSNHSEQGFWEVQTASLRDFPQQFRTFEIVRNSDNTISIIITNVDPAVREGSPAAMSRFYAMAARELYQTPPSISSNPVSELGPVTGTYNAELIKQLSPEMQTKIQSYGTPIQQ